MRPYRALDTPDLQNIYDNIELFPVNVQYLVDLLCYCRGNYQSLTQVPSLLKCTIEEYEEFCLDVWYRQKYANQKPFYNFICLQYSPNMEVIEHGFVTFEEATNWASSVKTDMYSRGLFGCMNPFYSGTIVESVSDSEPDDDYNTQGDVDDEDDAYEN